MGVRECKISRVSRNMEINSGLAGDLYERRQPVNPPRQIVLITQTTTTIEHHDNEKKRYL